jgi:hypothetical protein
MSEGSSMQIARVATLFLCLGISACTSSEPTSTSRGLSDMPPPGPPAAAPATWHTGATWRFTETDAAGKVVRSIVFRVTDRPQHSCLWGEWRQLQLVEGESPELANPAWSLDEGQVRILLATETCDSYPIDSGRFVGDAFEGEHQYLRFGPGKDLGAVHGVPLR